MLKAYYENKSITKPSFSGQRATCPLCHGTLIGKCGEIYIRHWQHFHDRNCDPWKEHETDWHRKWKEQFPDDWQEVIIEKDNVKHFADIKTAEGVVIEFQNSSISSSTIRIREDFYKNMIWVVNAITFKSNFNIRSVVKFHLRNIDEDSSNELMSMNLSYEEELKSIEEDIEKFKKNAEEKSNSINYKSEKIEKLNHFLKDSKNFINEVIDKWCKGDTYWDYLTNDITNKIKYESQKELNKITKEIESLKNDIEINNNWLQNISEYKDIPISDKLFKIVQYEQISSQSFKIARAISKKSRNTFFPESVEFRSELDFKRYQFQKENYDFAVDPTNAINAYNKIIENKKKSIETLENSLTIIKRSIANELYQELKNKIQELEIEIINLNNERKESLDKFNNLVVVQDKIYKKRDLDYIKYKNKIQKEKEIKRSKIMNEKKGKYFYEWKYERKSWKAAKCHIFFDIGESYLFELVRDGLFKKIEINEFLDRYLH